MKNIIRNIIHKFRQPKSKIAFAAQVSLDCTLGQGVRVFPQCKMGDCSVGDFSYVGDGSNFERTEIGSYCSIGRHVLCGLATHPLDFFTTYPGFYSKSSSGAIQFAEPIEFDDKKYVKIGSDVWIGSRAIILGGVKIGHGAVIGAGAVVTKDVEPYAIVGGVPAKFIRFRFSEDIRKILIESKWWTYSVSELRDASSLSIYPIDFIAQLTKNNYENLP